MFTSDTATRTEYEEPQLRAVLERFGHPEGRTAGGFSDAMLTAMQHADRDNLLRLGAVFPEFVMPFYVAARMSRGVEIVAGALALKVAGRSYRWVFIDAFDGRASHEILQQISDNLAGRAEV